MSAKNYTFGDRKGASIQLQHLAELYEPETRALLTRGSVHAPSLAVDLGCGPGWTTQLLHEVLKPGRTIGVDASKRFIEEARRDRPVNLEFHVQDVTQGDLLVKQSDALFCRFLLTHLSLVPQALDAWAKRPVPMRRFLFMKRNRLSRKTQ